MIALELGTVIGTLAAIFSVASFVPQALRIIRTKEITGLSRRMYLLTASAFALWLTFGILKNEWPLIVPNALCLILSLFILMMLVVPPKERERIAETLNPNGNI